MTTSKTPASKQRRVCQQCGMETTPGGLGLHQKATGHIGRVTPEAYDSMQSEAFVNRKVEARVQEEVNKAVSAALTRAHNDYKERLAEREEHYLNRKQEYLYEIDELNKRISIYNYVLLALILFAIIAPVTVLFLK